MVDHNEDKALVKRVQEGDLQAFNLLVLKYQSRINHLVSRFLRNTADVEDVTQDAFIKAYTDSMKLGQAEAKSMQPVMVQLDDYSQIGFEIERLDNDQVVIYLPGAPDPWAGTVAYFHSNRVKKLELSVSAAINSVRRLGRGSQAIQKEIQKEI